MDGKADTPKTCFSPIVGMLLMFAIGGVFHWLMLAESQSESPDEQMGWEFFKGCCLRHAVLLVSVLAWGLYVMLAQGKQIHCGGTRPFSVAAHGPRSARYMLVMIILFIVMTCCLAQGRWFWYLVISMVAGGSLAFEIGWGRGFFVKGW